MTEQIFPRKDFYLSKLVCYKNKKYTGRLRENLFEAPGPRPRGEDVPQDRPRHGQEGRCREDKDYASGVYW